LEEERQFLSVKKAAAKSSLSTRFLYEVCARKELRFYRVGKRILIDAKDLESFIAENVVEPINWEEKVKEFTRGKKDGEAVAACHMWAWSGGF